MLLKAGMKPEDRIKIITYLGGFAQIALVTSLFLSRMNLPGLDFVEGLLLGFSLVGNLTFLIYHSKTRSEK
jgi:hypothetical protein